LATALLDTLIAARELRSQGAVRPNAPPPPVSLAASVGGLRAAPTHSEPHGSHPQRLSGVSIEAGRASGQAQGIAPDLLNLERRQLEAFFLYLHEEGYAANTVLRHFRGLAAFFSWLAAEDLIDRSPMERLRPPRVKLDLPPVLSYDAIGRLLQACEGRDFEARRDAALTKGHARRHALLSSTDDSQPREAPFRRDGS